LAPPKRSPFSPSSRGPFRPPRAPTHGKTPRPQAPPLRGPKICWPCPPFFPQRQTFQMWYWFEPWPPLPFRPKNRTVALPPPASPSPPGVPKHRCPRPIQTPNVPSKTTPLGPEGREIPLTPSTPHLAAPRGAPRRAPARPFPPAKKSTTNWCETLGHPLARRLGPPPPLITQKPKNTGKPFGKKTLRQSPVEAAQEKPTSNPLPEPNPCSSTLGHPSRAHRPRRNNKTPRRGPPFPPRGLVQKSANPPGRGPGLEGPRWSEYKKPSSRKTTKKKKTGPRSSAGPPVPRHPGPGRPPGGFSLKSGRRGRVSPLTKAEVGRRAPPPRP